VNVIPVDRIQTMRKLRVQCLLRVIGGEHTVVLVLKKVGHLQGSIWILGAIHWCPTRGSQSMNTSRSR